MDTILIRDLAVWYRVGVTDQERARPQHLLLNVDLAQDFSRAAHSDDLRDTIDYFAVAQGLLRFGDTREWKLIEKLAADMADWLFREYGPKQVRLEIRKFVIPEAQYVAVVIERGHRRVK